MPAELNIIRPRLPQYQRDMIYAPEGNTITEATTKAGKTFSHIWWLFEQAHKPPTVFDELALEFRPKEGANYWWVAPVYAQAEIAFARIKRTLPKGDGNGGYRINESDLKITTPLGTVLWFKSAEKPDNLYGEDVYAAVLDEVTRMKEEAWFAVRTTLTATRGTVKMIGNVKGTGNWAYKLARRVEAGELPGWRHFKITCADAVAAGILEQDEIDAAERELPRGIFLELYFGIPFVNSSNKFAFSFDKDKHVKACQVDTRFPVYLSFDFNRNPISCVVAQHVDGVIRIPYAVKLENSNIYELCRYLKNKLTIPGKPAPVFIINGDASGSAGSALVPDNLNYFRVIKNELKIPAQRMKQLAVNPRIAENQVLVNACLEHVPHEIDPANAAALIFDLEFATMLADGTLKKTDRTDPTQQLDALDGYRYYLNANFRHLYRALNYNLAA